MRHVWRKQYRETMNTFTSTWVCGGCGFKVEGNSRAEPETLARWDKVPADCNEQIVKDVLES